MKIKFLSLLIVFITIVLTGCGSSSAPVVKKTSVSGVVQKGPFLQGSIAKIFKLDGSYERTSTMMQTTISDDEGSYSFANITWSGLSEIEVTGRFLNENTGDDSKSATVTSIVMVQEDGSVNTNINILTHMASGQVKKLLKEGKTLEEANAEVVGEVFAILGRTDLGIDDFGDLDLADLLGANATANSELLFLSAALLKSTHYMQDLETLLTLYKEGGIEAVLGSALYARLMQERQELDETTIVSQVNKEASEVQIAQLKIIPMVQITRVLMSDVVDVRLYGTKFTSKTPNITFDVSGGVVTKGAITVADDNKSATIAISGDTSGCQDVYLSVGIDYLELEETSTPLTSNRINLHPTTVICNDNQEGAAEIQFQPNHPPVAIIGMMDDAVDGQQAPKNITVAVGSLVSGLETHYSYDQDLYPQGGITHCEWKDENNEVIKSSNNNDCSIYDKVFDTAGDYTYTLTVTDNRDATNSNTIIINVQANSILPSDSLPMAKINESNITVNQEIYAGNAPYAMPGGSDDHGIVYCKWQDAIGTILVEKDIVPSVTQLYYMDCEVQFPLLTKAGDYVFTFTLEDTVGQEDNNELHVTVLQNALPTVEIGSNRTTNVGETLEIIAQASDADDGDTLTLQWMYQKVGSSTSHGAGSADTFSHSFSEAGDYNVSIIARDSHGAQASDFLIVTVGINHPPVPSLVIQGDAISNVNVAEGFSATATDADGDEETLSFYFSYGLVGGEATDTAVFTDLSEAYIFSHTFTKGGKYLVQLHVKDALSAYSSASVEIDIITPTGPTPIPQIQSIDVASDSSNNPITLEVAYAQGDDASTHNLSYIVSQQPEHGTLSGAGKNLSYTPNTGFDGNDYFVWGVEEEDGSPSSTTVVDITVKPASVIVPHTVTIGDLMWEDSTHVVGSANYVTWSEAESYCSSLTLGTFANWRLPHSTMNSGGDSEIMTIRVEATDDTNNTIVEAFTPIYQSDRIGTWTDEEVNDNLHVVMIFQYDIGNGDGFANNDDEINVRCVRDVE